MDTPMSVELEQIFSANDYLDHLCIHPPGSEGNPYREELWLAAALSGGTPTRAWGENPGQAIHNLRTSLEQDS